MSVQRPPLILVDGSSYLYRAYHALPPLTNSAGEPTGAVYGAVNMLRKLLAEYAKAYFGVIFDAKGKTFRDDLFQAYKANRAPMPADLRAQVEPLKHIVCALGVPLIEVAGVEADDVIGTLAVRARAAGLHTIIATNDKDIAQIVSPDVVLLNSAGVQLDAAAIKDKFGVPPECMVDYLALVGDAVDNIPGVPRVGPKTAAKWLTQYGSLDALLEHANKIKGKVGESLRGHLDQLALSRKLATIRCDLELDLNPTDLQCQAPDVDALLRLYRRYAFNRWLAELEDENPAVAGSEQPILCYETVLDDASLQRWLACLASAEVFALDLETTSLNYMDAEIVGVSFAVEPRHAAYVPVAHTGLGVPAQLDRDYVLEQLKPLLEDPQYAKLGQNLKYDMSVLARYDIVLRGVRFDTMLESYVLDSTATRHDMDSLALKYLDHRTIKFEDVAGKGAKQLTFDQVAVDRATEYAAEDADVTLQLHQALYPRLQQLPGPEHIFRSIEMPLIPVLSRMERTGVLVSRELLAQHSRELAHSLAKVEVAVYRTAGCEFNLGSPKQIQAILYEQQGLPVLAKTPKGAPSTAESVLQELALNYPLPRLILEYRSLAKLKSTYTDKLPLLIHPRTGRVHTSYHQAVAATGRLSSSDPNLQNIPVRSPDGRRIRRGFIAREGYRLLSADYSQVELRIMAHLSGDDGLQRAFAAGEDVHRATAAEVFGISPSQVTPEQRRAAKAINFGLIYGMSAYGLGRQLGIERDAAQHYVERYFERYLGVKAFMERIRREAHERQYVATVFGRRLYLPEINASNQQRRQAAERTAINAPMQGSAADIIKRAMIQVDQWLQRERDDVFMVLQVHDELVFEVPAPDVQVVGERIREFMVDAAELSIPLVVSIGSGDNWDEAH